MKRKYNLALTPSIKSATVIALAQKFANIADGYLLGQNSLPHVTLYQFTMEEENINAIWDKVSSAWQEQPIELEFNKISCVTFDNVIFWVALLPNKIDTLQNMHRQIAASLNMPIKQSFDPHMTLLNTRRKNPELQIGGMLDAYLPLKDLFTLSLGRADEIGQFIRVVK